MKNEQLARILLRCTFLCNACRYNKIRKVESVMLLKAFCIPYKEQTIFFNNIFKLSEHRSLCVIFQFV